MSYFFFVRIEVDKEPCKSCGKDGSELLCEKCNKCFHLSCAEPRMRKAPRGKWTCEKCKIKASTSKKAGMLNMSLSVHSNCV